MKRLIRALSLADLTVLASSSMAPAYSIATVMGLVVAAAGLGAPLALVVSTIPIACIASGFLRVSSRLPSAGGVYSWSRAAFGNRAGWFSAVLIIIAYYFGTIATAVPAGTYSVVFAAPRFAAAPPPMLVALVGILWIAFSTYFLIIGARPTAKLSAFFVGFELLALAAIALLAFAHPFTGSAPPRRMPLGLGLGTSGADGLIIGAVLSIWITAGWEISTYSSEESIKGQTIPGLGAMIGLLGTTLVVVVCMIGFLRVGTIAGFTQHQSDALAYVAQRLGGGWVTWLMTVTVLVSTVICGLACAWLFLRERRPAARYPFSAIVVPSIGAVVTLVFLIYSTVTEQPQIVQLFSAAGVIVAVAFAAVAGRWSPPQTTAFPPQEELSP